MITQGNLPRFIRRKDKQSYDFTLDDFIRDDSYQELDLSDIVPNNAVAVVIWGYMLSDTAGAQIELSPYDYTGTYLRVIKRQPVADILKGIDCIIPIDSKRKIQYRLQSAPVFKSININIAAYFV